MTRHNRSKSIAFLPISLFAVSLPLGVLWYQSLPFAPIHADSADHLWLQVFRQQHSHIAKELGQRGINLVKQSDATTRGNILQ